MEIAFKAELFELRQGNTITMHVYLRDQNTGLDAGIMNTTFTAVSHDGKLDTRPLNVQNLNTEQLKILEVVVTRVDTEPPQLAVYPVIMFSFKLDEVTN